MTTYKTLRPERIEYLIVHCSATRPSQDIGAVDIDRWHRQRGWFSIGYHWVIRRDGTLELGRDQDRPGAHARNYNGKSLGICMVGGVSEDDVNEPEDNFTDAQWRTLQDLLLRLSLEHPKAKIIGHNQVSAKACPSFDVAAKLASWGMDEKCGLLA